MPLSTHPELLVYIQVSSVSICQDMLFQSGFRAIRQTMAHSKFYFFNFHPIDTDYIHSASYFHSSLIVSSHFCFTNPFLSFERLPGFAVFHILKRRCVFRALLKPRQNKTFAACFLPLLSPPCMPLAVLHFYFSAFCV